MKFTLLRCDFRTMPFPKVTCFILGSVFSFTSKGVYPVFVFISTAPEVRSPKVTDGIPRMTSTDSIWSVAICRRSMPEPTAVLKLSPDLEVEKVCMLASLETGAPSTIIAAPIALLSSCPISRIEIRCADLRSGLAEILPGISCITSARLVGCTCSMAAFPMIDEVVIPLSFFDVTVISSISYETGIISILKFDSDKSADSNLFE